MASLLLFTSGRLPLWRTLVAVLLGLALVTPVAAESVPRKFAGIVVDAKSGKTLYESSADAYRYPASVTKVMTLYVLFQELAAGNIKLSDKMKVSKHAAAAVPTKLGLKVGSTITVENAIKAITTLSANDIARVIAEHISGSEDAFGKRMTATAKSLGMSRTQYYNASGLPDKRQITTVRDQAVLAIAVYEHFPKYYAYFQTKSFSYGKRTYSNHNRLLGSNGVDGIKTGYTGASGFNLMTAARKDNRHIVVIGFGFDSGNSRDAKVRDLVKSYLPKARSGSYLETAAIPYPGRKGAVAKAEIEVAAVPVTPMPPPSFRDVSVFAYAATSNEIAARVTAAKVASVPTDLGIKPALRPQPAKAVDVIGAWLDGTFVELGAPPAPLGQTRPSTSIVPPVGVGANGQPIDLMTSGSVKIVEVAEITAPQPIPQKLPSGWVVQIGSAPTETGASGLLETATTKLADLDSFKPFVERFEKDGQTYYRARFAGFDSSDDAARMCSKLKKAKMSCLAMQG